MAKLGGEPVEVGPLASGGTRGRLPLRPAHARLSDVSPPLAIGGLDLARSIGRHVTPSITSAWRDAVSSSCILAGRRAWHSLALDSGDRP